MSFRYVFVPSRNHRPSMSLCTDIWLHIRSLGRHHRFDHLRRREFTCRPGGEHECGCTFDLFLTSLSALHSLSQVFAPIMGFSACFGGPMLNILLGVGISGSYVIYNSGEAYKIHFSNTLMVSAIGLLTLLMATLVFVPWHGYFLTKQWGMFLIASYTVIMALNVFVELKK